MQMLEDEILGFKKLPIETRKVKFSEYLKTKFNLDLKDLQNSSERDLIRLGLRLSLDQTNFLNNAIRNDYWEPEFNVNLVYIEKNKIIQTNPSPHIQYELIENQLNSHYMKKCPNKWLENCLAYNTGHKIDELRSQLF